jgi:hypothetical protein
VESKEITLDEAPLILFSNWSLKKLINEYLFAVTPQSGVRKTLFLGVKRRNLAPSETRKFSSGNNGIIIYKIK